jgi:hypothetical protein
MLLQKGKKIGPMCCLFSHGIYKQTYDRIYEQVVAILDVKDFPKPHWSNLIGWGMASYMHELVLKKARDLVKLLGLFPFLVMKLQPWINSLGFPYMHMCLKIGSKPLCSYLCNGWLMGPL